jgi:DNA polymerase III subunit delta'
MAFPVDRAYELITSAHERGKLAHALLISGNNGSGKELLAAKICLMLQNKAKSGLDLFSEAVSIDSPTLNESENVQIIRPEKLSRGINVKAVRETEKRLHMASEKGSWKIVVIVDADRMNLNAQNAFLKTLEEPPNQTILLLTTSQPNALLPTIISRCIKLPLMGNTDYRAHGGNELITTLNKVAESNFGTPLGALTIKNVFSQVLDQRKSAIESAQKELSSAEEKMYRQTTDGKWLKEREDFHKARGKITLF